MSLNSVDLKNLKPCDLSDDNNEEYQTKIISISGSVLESLKKENLTYDEVVQVLHVCKILLGRTAKLRYTPQHEDSNGVYERGEGVACSKDEWEKRQTMKTSF